MAAGFCQFCFADGHPSVTWSVLDHERAPKAGYLALRDACRSALPMLEPRAGLVHVVNEHRKALLGAVVETVVDGQPRRFTGDVPADGLAFIGRIDGVTDATSASLTLRHPELGEVRNDYDGILEWLRIVSG